MDDIASRIREKYALRRQNAANNATMQDRNPVAVARAKRMEQAFGIPSPFIEADPDLYQRQYDREQAEETIRQHPWMARYLESDRDSAAIAGPDLPKIGNATSWLTTPDVNLYRSFQGDKPANPVNNLGEIGRAGLGLPEQPHGINILAERMKPTRERDLTDIITGAREQSGGHFQPIEDSGATWSLTRGLHRSGVGGVFAGTVAMGMGGLAGLGQVLTPPGALHDEFNAARETAREMRDFWTPEWARSNRAGQYAFGGAQMLMDMAAGGGLVRGGTALAGLFGGLVGTEAAGKYDARGAGGVMTVAGLPLSVAGGAIEGGAEYIFEHAPMGTLFGRFGRAAGEQIAEGFLKKYLKQEVAGEVATTIVQQAADTAIANPNKTWGDFIHELPSDVLDTVGTVLAGGAFIGGVHVAQSRFEVRQAKTQQDVNIGLQGQAMLDGLMSNVENIDMRRNAPEQFAEMIAHASEHSPVKNVYVPIEAIEAYLQSEKVTPEEREFFTLYQDQIEEAQRTRGDVVIPVGDVAAHLPGTTAWEALRDDVRVTSDGLSGREAREQREAMVAELDKVGKTFAQEGETEGEAMAPKLQVFNEVRNRALAAGRTAREAETTALLVANHAEAMGAQTGQTAAEFFDKFGIELKEGGKFAKGAVAQGPLVNIGLATNDGQGITDRKALNALKKLGVTVRNSAVQQSDTEQTLVAELDRALTPEEGQQLSEVLSQEAIAQFVGGKGDLFGPQAENWGPFNPDFFMTLEGGRLDPKVLQQASRSAGQDVMPSAGWTEERIGGLIQDYGYSMNDDSKAYAVMMSPDEFLGLTASAKGRAMIEERVQTLPGYNRGSLREEKLAASGPIFLYVQIAGEPSDYQKNTLGVKSLDSLTFGHEGRHRMTMMKRAGITQVPVVVHVENKKVSEDLAELRLIPQRSRNSPLESGDTKATLRNLIPINWKNRDRLLAMGGGEFDTLFQGPSENFQKWFGDSKVVDEDGVPLVVYRGEHGGKDEDIHTRLPAITFGSRKAAEIYANSPNNRKDVVVKPRIISAYLRIEKPFLNDATDPFVDLNHIEETLGKEAAIEAAEDFAGSIENTNNWEELTEELGESPRSYSVKELIAQHPDKLSSLYFDAYELLDNEKWVERLKKAGFDGAIHGGNGETALEAEYKVFDQRQVKSTANSGAFNPNDPRIMAQGPRGMAQFPGDGTALITLFDTADFSTMIHELGHVFLEQHLIAADLPSATPRLKEDVAKIKGWFAAHGHEVRNGYIPTEAHELFARSFERYAREGKAPSTELRGAFNTFRSWLTTIYESVKALNAPITDDIRGVMDRMLATEEAIAANVILPMTQEQLGMTDAEYADYLESAQGVRDDAFDTLLEKMMAAIRRRDNKKMQDQRASIRADVAAEINSRPEFKALHLLRTGMTLGDPDAPRQDVKLNTGWLIDTYGEEVLDKLPRGLPIARGDGISGDLIAEMVGMDSGDQLVQTLIAMRKASEELKAAGQKLSLRDKAIEEATDAVMAQRHGDVAMSDEAIEEEAVAALNSQRQGEQIATEIRQLRKRTKEGVATPYQIAREWARRKVAEGRVVDVASRAAVQRYIRATNKAQRAAEEAILKGDADEAFRQKQAQMLNHALLAESKAAADEVEAIVKRMKTLAGRKSMKSVDQDYMDRIHQVLEAYDFRTRSQTSIDEQTGFQEWAAAQAALGREVHVPPRLLERGEPYSRITVATLNEVNDTVQSLIHLGRVKQRIKDAQEERDFNELRDEIVARVSNLPERNFTKIAGVNLIHKGPLLRREELAPIDDEKDQRGRMAARAAAALLKVETIADELDGGSTGPLNNLLVVGAERAATERDMLTEKVMVPLARLYHSLSKKQRARLDEKVTIPELTWNAVREGDPRQGQQVTMTRMQLLTVALNSGNISNLEKMSKGERWPAPTIQSVLQREMNKDDWDFVHAIWRGVELLWPDIARVERELSGVVPEAVVPMDIETPFGPYQGGYWPVVYDSARSQRAENNADDEANDMFGFKSGVGTPKGHTITRTGAVGPIRFSLEEVLLGHVEKVVTRIAYAPWVRDVLRVVENPKIRGIIDTRLGPEYRRQIKPWLKRQIAANAIDRRGAAWWEKGLRQFRTNMSITAMGFAYSTGIAQTLGLGFSAGRIGAMGEKKGHMQGLKYTAIGLKRMVHPTEGWAAAQEFVFSRSPEMKRRGHEMNREVVEVFQKLRGGATWYTNAQAMAFWHIAMIDRYMVAMPTWLGAHQKGLDEGLTDEEATAFADKAVRLSQGSGREKDLAAVQSPNSEAFRFLTMFYTPFNVQFNSQWEAVRAGKGGDWRRAMVLSTFFLGATALADALMSGDWPDDEDKDGFPSVAELAGWFARNVFFSLFAGVPVARDVANVGERKLRGEYGEWGQTPISSAFKSAERAYSENKQSFGEAQEPITSEWIRANFMAAGYLFGIPGNQAGKTTGFLWDVGTGDVQPDTVRDWYSGITSGKVPEDEE